MCQVSSYLDYPKGFKIAVSEPLPQRKVILLVNGVLLHVRVREKTATSTPIKTRQSGGNSGHTGNV